MTEAPKLNYPDRPCPGGCSTVGKSPRSRRLSRQGPRARHRPWGSAGRRGEAVQGVGEPVRRGERHLVVAVDLGNGGAVEPAAHPRVPETGWHGMGVGEGEEGGGEVEVQPATQTDGVEGG